MKYKRKKIKRRVAFIAHALLPSYLSSELIERVLRHEGRNWPKAQEEPGFIKWLSFPVLAPQSSNHGRNVWVDFYIIPVFADRFLQAVNSGEAYRWVEAVAKQAIIEAETDGTPLWIGWGALVKNAVHHGNEFLTRHTELLEGHLIYTTHGDAGTVALTLKALQKSGVGVKDTVAVIGANGAIGAALARCLPSFLSPRKIVLIGKLDEPCESRNLNRLEELAAEVKECAQGKTTVLIHQDKSRACLALDANVVVITTIGMQFHPAEVPKGALIVDVTTPSACAPEHDWSNQLVILAGCGQFQDKLLPEGFKDTLNRQLKDIGAAVSKVGGERVIWGCTGETIAQAMFGYRYHAVGQHMEISAVIRAMEWFKKLSFEPQPPVSFGRELGWEEVKKR